MSDNCSLSKIEIYVPDWVEEVICTSAFEKDTSPEKVATLFFMKAYASKMSQTVLVPKKFMQAVSVLIEAWDFIGKKTKSGTSLGNNLEYNGGTIDDLRSFMEHLVKLFEDWQKEGVE